VGHVAPIVSSVDDEDRLMGTCACSGAWRMAANAVEPVRGRWLDLVVVTCSACGAKRMFGFDITAFFDARPGIWSGSHLSAKGSPTRLALRRQSALGVAA
jgi:hypothetical protein